MLRGGNSLVWFFLVSSLLFATTFCNADGKTVEVVGVGECADCAENNFDTSQAFSGLRVTIDCKAENGGDYFKTQGSGELDKEGKFKVSLPQHLIEDGKLKEKCYAKLHNSESSQPCPNSHDNLESTKLVFKSTNNEKHQLGLMGTLKFSPITCASALFWLHHHKKSFLHGHHYPHPPIYKKPLPPLVPIYKKPHPIPVYKKPLPPPVPIYKPPVYKPHPVPVYKKPLPPPIPIYKPPIMYKPHPDPVYKKPLPPPIPIYKPKPFPHIPHKPLPKIPSFPKKPCPPIPKLPPKYLHHPKFGKWPPLPPFAAHHP